MARRNLLWTFTPPLFVILLVAIVLVTGFAGRAMRIFFIDRSTEELQRQGKVLEARFAPLVEDGDYPGVQAACQELGRISGSRLTIILPDGKVVGDSRSRPDQMENHADRPEIAAALRGETGSAIRYSPTLGHQRLYVAIPSFAADPAAVGFVLRTSVPLTQLNEVTGRVNRRIALVGLALFLVAGGASLLLSRAFGQSLGRLQAGAQAFARGDLSRRLRISSTTEIAAVAEAMNAMAEQLGERIATIENQRNELEAVLTSMVEGVLAVDTDENVMNLNRAGCRLLGVNRDTALGRTIQEVGKNPMLTRLAQDALAGRGPLERDLHLGAERNVWVQVHASCVVSPGGETIGALLVLNDITRLRRLETMRRDFVANVSHELKTPITSIKGFVETLIEDPPEEPAELERFLAIINKQADRLDSIISDLLALSRLEKESDNGGIEVHSLPLGSILERVLRDLFTRRPEAETRVALRCPAEARARINAPLVEQAVTNLLENALKYSPDGSPIALECSLAGADLVISVRDEGPGIAAEHLPRLFERFYRVDKARSRQMGGTGLGLAIVKHIAQVHHGRVEVQSRLGEGSTFSLHIPREVEA
ncbi:MAG: ATP-binding protein [bacterium]